MKKTIFTFMTCLFMYATYAQVETNYYGKNVPGTRTGVMALPVKGKVFVMPPFDAGKLLEEDEEMKDHDVPYRFGKGFDVSLSLKDGKWESVEGGRLWSLTVKSDGALSLNFVLENFHLPDNAYLYIKSKDDVSVYGPVRRKDIASDGFFLTDLLAGSEATICLYEPIEQKGKSTLTIKRVVHGYRGLTGVLYGDVGAFSDSNVDVACYPQWENESKAVGLVLLANGSALCSGSLLMSTDISFKPYFLTAFHCIDIDYPLDRFLSLREKSEAERWMFKFCFRKRSCNGNSLAVSYSYNNATFRAAYNETDFALMEINHDLSTNENLYWLGWDKSGDVPTHGVGIHHPKGDVMKISIENNPFESRVWTLNPPISERKQWHVNFDVGIVNKGSSGSPIMNEKNRVVGQLIGGRFLDEGYYGKLSESWRGGGSNSTRLSNWLDPLGSNQSTIGGRFPFAMTGTYYACDKATFKISNLVDGASVRWYTDNPSVASISQNGELTVHTIEPQAIQVCAEINVNGVHLNKMKSVDIGIPNMTINPITSVLVGENGEKGRYYCLNVDYGKIKNRGGLEYLNYIWYREREDGGLTEVRRYNDTHISNIQPFVPLQDGKRIYVRVRMEGGGCVKTFTYTPSDDDKYMSFHLLSNPVKSSATIVLNDKQERGIVKAKHFGSRKRYEVQLWNNTSLLRTYKSSLDYFQFSVADLPRGTYFVRVVRDGRTCTRKLLKE